MGCMLIDNVEMFVEFHQPVGVEELTDQLVADAVLGLQEFFFEKI